MFDAAALISLKKSHPDILVEYVERIESTQSAVAPNSVLLCNHQTNGVGRRGHSWLSPAGKSISFSYRFVLSTTANKMAGYQMTAALALIQTMASFEQTVTAKLKWPNDLYFQHKKFAGVLINLKPIDHQTLDVTLGIGINWSLTTSQLASVNQDVCNIPLRNQPSRIEFLDLLIHQLKLNNQKFLNHGLNPFLTQWQPYDALVNQEINLNHEHDTTSGRYLGIDSQGQLMAEIDGQIKHFSSGEVSVRII